MRKLFAFVILALAGAAGATVPSSTSEVSYSCNGTTTVHAVPFRFLEASHLVVTKTLSGATTTLTITTDYTVQNTGTVSGGEVTLTAGSKCASGYTLRIARAVPLTQGTSFRSQGSFSPAAHENAFDRLTMAAQQLQREKVSTYAFQGTWSSTVSYAAGAIVQSGGSLYIATASSTDSQPPSTPWTLWLPGGNPTPLVGDGSTATVTATGSTTARTMADMAADVLNVKSFGAVPGDGFDDRVDFQETIDAASLTPHRRVFIPNGRWRLTQANVNEILRITAPISIECESPTGTILEIAATVPNTADVFHYVGTGANFKHLSLTGCGIVPESGKPARYFVNIDSTTAAIADFTIARNYVEQLGGGAIVNTNPALSDGWFTSTIKENFFVGGIHMNRAGDSIRIENNTITGDGIGIDWDSVAGANNGVIAKNNMTPAGPAIRFRTGYRPVIRDNTIEPPYTGGNYPGVPLIDVVGAVGAEVYEPLFQGNVLLASLVANTNAIKLDRALHPIIDPNVIYVAGTGAGVVTTANAVDVKIDSYGASWAVGPTRVNDVSGTAAMRVWAPYKETGEGGVPYFSGTPGKLSRWTAAPANSIFMGTGAGNAASSGGHNFFAGTNAGASVTTGAGNIGIGYQALNAATTAGDNVAVGSSTLTLATGGGNVAIGSGACSGVTTGTNNSCFGASSSAGAAGAVNRTVIGEGATGVADNSVTIGRAGQTVYSPAQVSFTALPVYADNATATGAGLAAGRLYRTATGQVMVVY